LRASVSTAMTRSPPHRVNAGGMERFRRGGKENAWDLMARATRLGRDSAAGPTQLARASCSCMPAPDGPTASDGWAGDWPNRTTSRLCACRTPGPGGGRGAKVPLPAGVGGAGGIPPLAPPQLASLPRAARDGPGTVSYLHARGAVRRRRDRPLLRGRVLDR
jgi:hypothetical protein